MKNNLIIKGRFNPFDKSLLWIAFSVIVLFILLCQRLSSDAPMMINNKLIREIVVCLFFAGFSLLSYWRTSARYYFYELASDKIITRNILKKYERTFLYDNIIKIKLIGNLEFPVLYNNTIHIIYNEKNVQKSYTYQSIQLETKDWQELITALRARNIVCEDTHNNFFRDSDLNNHNYQ
ncbi:MAG: hypothetical protein ACTHJT_14525 [Cytophaga sp.]|uniref:hypothetical protein n=1 Tax=Cytophaga sp. TaxID=29535 RepID=UPI003F7F4572